MEDEQYAAIVGYLDKQNYPAEYTKSQKYVLRRSCKSYKMQQGKLYYVDTKADGTTFDRIVLQKNEVDRVFLECHLTAGGHKGRDSTIAKIKERYYWPNYYKEIEERIKLCERCQRNAPQLKTAAIELQPIAVAPKVWYLVGMDLIGPFKATAQRHQYVLTMTDYFTKFVEAVPIEDKSAISVARGIYKVYCRQGAPVHIITDQGKEFVNQTNEALQRAFDVKMRITAAYHPQSNGLDERTNQTLKRSMSKLMEDFSDDWEKYLDSAIFATNTSVQTSTKHTPFQLMYGREARFPLQAEKEAESNKLDAVIDDFCKVDIEQYIKNCFEKQKSIFLKTEIAIKAAQDKQKQQYAQRKGIAEYGFKIGDKVLRRNMQQKTKKGKKMEDRWLGPYIIVEISKTSCLLKNKSDKILKQRINICQLKPYLEMPCQNDHDYYSVTSGKINTNSPPVLEQDMQVSTDDAPLSSDHLSVGVSDQSSARISDQPSLNAAQLSIRINDQSTIRSNKSSIRSNQESVTSGQPSVKVDQASIRAFQHDSFGSYHDDLMSYQENDDKKLEPFLAGSSAFVASTNNKLLDEVDASSTPVHAGGFFPTFFQNEGQLSPIVSARVLNAANTRKTLIDEALASPQGIEKCKRLLTFSTNDDCAVKKVRKRKLIPPHSQPDGNPNKKSKNDVNCKANHDDLPRKPVRVTSRVKKTDLTTFSVNELKRLKEGSDTHKLLERIWKGQPCHVIKARIKHFSIHHGSFHSLKHNCYLNDEIINGYLRLLADIHGNSFVIPSQTLTTIINRSTACHRSYLLSKECLHQKRYLIGCHNQDGNHWIFIAIDLESKHFYYLDPYGPSHAVRGTFAALKKYFKTRSDHLQSDNVILDKFEAHQLNCKVQFDPFNCGVFSLKIAEQLLLSGVIDESYLKNMDITQARINIAVTILSNSVDMTERCVMCGASDTSVNHPDYRDWIKCDQCKCWTHAYCASTAIAEAKKREFFCVECYQNKHNIKHFAH